MEVSGGARPLCSIAGQGRNTNKAPARACSTRGALGWLGRNLQPVLSQLGTQPSSPWNGNIYFRLSRCAAHGPCLASWRARAGLWDGQGWDQSWHSSTGVTRIGDKHPGTTRERVLGLGSCFALCLKILEPDKMGLEGGFSHGFEFFQVS